MDINMNDIKIYIDECDRLRAINTDLLKAIDGLLQYSRIVSSNFHSADPMRKQWFDSCEQARAAITRAKAG